MSRPRFTLWRKRENLLKMVERIHLARVQRTFHVQNIRAFGVYHSTAQVKGKGKLDLVFTSGNTLTLKDVLHVPDVRKNSVSGPLLNKFSFKLLFESNKFILSKDGKSVGKGYHTSGTFKLNIKDGVNSSVNDVNILINATLIIHLLVL
ncbi:hypothetical protein CTI12_AA252040 [Artemisia annua]|uniref:Retrovirus-related Pol polyprotein from transposon TNT 1-94-like beta-barrel domain-containing protein n=1 Tax=Artemisia annua TaxID=35608 RepID=A0A2U1NLT6_ARTAN|nr:hypothetical protein CTI12_AA252040 [Artemisia annua]